MDEYKIGFIIGVEDFEQAFDRKPKSKNEFEEFCHYCEKGLMNGHIDWDIVFGCAKDAMADEFGIKEHNETITERDNKAKQKRLVFDNDNYFGHCLIPEHENFYLNIGRQNWMYCDECKIRWFMGENLISTWRQENEDIWEKNYKKIKDYEELDINEESPETLSEPVELE